jgi:hypothetical protein
MIILIFLNWGEFPFNLSGTWTLKTELWLEVVIGDWGQQFMEFVPIRLHL